MKKMLSLIICILLLVSVLPVGVMAQEQAAESLLGGDIELPAIEAEPEEISGAEEPGEEVIPGEEEIPADEETPAVEEEPATEEAPAEEEEDTSAADGTEEERGSVSCAFAYVNPLYKDIIREEDLVPAEQHVNLDGAAAEYFTSVSNAAALVRQQMVARNETIRFSYKATFSDFKEQSGVLMSEVFAEAMVHTGAATEGDYLAFQIGGAYMDIEAEYIGTTYYMDVVFYISYYTTADEESDMDQMVDVVMDLLAFTKADTPCKKALTIYAFICEYVEYDHEHKNDDTYLPQFTAYGALINQKAVCQGYAVLFYRLALEAGLDVRVIAGDAGGGHAWNIIKIGDRYYNLDATWDDELWDGSDLPGYFLTGTDTFYEDHTPGGCEGTEMYAGDAFWADYDMSEEDFDCLSAVMVIGDVNDDGSVTAEDAEEILAWINGLESVLDEGNTRMVNSARVTADDVIDSRDATQILRYTAGLTSVYDTF